MRGINCYVEGLEGRGIFVGCCLNYCQNVEKTRRNKVFEVIVKNKLNEFLSIYDYSIENMEKYFNRLDLKSHIIS